jgi:outer membrane immunogenic protein
METVDHVIVFTNGLSPTVIPKLGQVMRDGDRRRGLMNRLIFGAVALAAVAAPAYAADLAVNAPVYKAAPPLFTWAGAYIGASVGGIWADDQITDLDGFRAFQTFSLKSAGVIGGGVLGYNFQSGSFVYGVEADLGGISWNKTIGEPGPALASAASNHLGSGFYSDVTGRIGFTASDTLFYAKGGWAMFDGKASVTNVELGTVSTGNFNGWTAGAGIEYAFANCWSAKVEYQHFDFGSQTATLVNPKFGTSFRFSNDLTADAVKIGVNYHFH